MGNLLMEKLKAEHGEPSRKGGKGIISPLMVYVKENYEEIQKAIKEGYSYKQLVSSISGIIGMKCSVRNFSYILACIKKEQEEMDLLARRMENNIKALKQELNIIWMLRNVLKMSSQRR